MFRQRFLDLSNNNKYNSTEQCTVNQLKCYSSIYLLVALETKVSVGERRSDGLVRDKTRLEAELEAITKKSHDASGQLVIISQELLKKER